MGAEDITAVRDSQRFDEQRLAGYLHEHVTDFAGPLTVQQFTGGQSNPTYLLSTPARRYVLRRKPSGELLPSAHAIEREYRVMHALGAHTQVPVPRALALCLDETVIGTRFFIMEYVTGRIFWDGAFPEVAARERAAYFDAMNATLAQLHAVDYVAAGLADYGKPADYVRRQIARWSGQYRQDAAAGRVPIFERLMEWLGAHVPARQEVALVHGDFRCDNLLFDTSEPRVLAILDWELSTLGDPLADFAYHLMMYYSSSDSRGLAGRSLSELGIPTPEQYVAAYCGRTGRSAIEDLDFYLAFNFFRSAAICHGIRGRIVRGTAVSARAKEHAARVEQSAELGWAHAQRG